MYVGYMSYMSCVSYMGIFMNHLKSLEIAQICFKYVLFSKIFQKFFVNM